MQSNHSQWQEQRKSHANLQKAYFDRLSATFCQPIPEQITQRTKQIVEAAQLNCDSRVLDVGTGVGVLIPHFLEMGVPLENITACDLSTAMLEIARQRFKQAHFWQGDFLDFPLDLGPFDAIFINGCFGNFYCQEEIVKNCVSLLVPGGRLIISHPLGAQFVAALNQSEPEIVPHLLPDKSTLTKWSQMWPVELALLQDTPQLYLAILRKTKS